MNDSTIALPIAPGHGIHRRAIGSVEMLVIGRFQLIPETASCDPLSGDPLSGGLMEMKV